MKINLILLISCMILVLCSYKKIDNVKRETYRYVNDMALSNYIVLEKKANSISGTYYGVEFNQDAVLIYFKSDIVCNLDNTNISFALHNFKFSYKPLYVANADSVFITDKNKWPVILSFHPRFFGKLYNNILSLQRTFDIYDNKADNMLFLKVQGF